MHFVFIIFAKVSQNQRLAQMEDQQRYCQIAHFKTYIIIYREK